MAFSDSNAPSAFSKATLCSCSRSKAFCLSSISASSFFRPLSICSLLRSAPAATLSKASFALLLNSSTTASNAFVASSILVGPTTPAITVGTFVPWLAIAAPILAAPDRKVVPKAAIKLAYPAVRPCINLLFSVFIASTSFLASVIKDPMFARSAFILSVCSFSWSVIPCLAIFACSVKDVFSLASFSVSLV